MTAEFGNALKAWFRQNSWPQNVPELWARAVGSENGPWGSQISIAMQGRLQPKPPFFQALGEFNRCVAERDLKAITDRRLRDRLVTAEPMCREDGTPYDAADFFRLYIGELTWAAPDSPEMTMEDVQTWTEEVRDLFTKLCRFHMCSRAEGWQMIEPALANQPPDDVQFVRDVLAGLLEPTLEQATRVNRRHAGQTPLVDVMTSLIGDEELGKKARRARARLDSRHLKPVPPDGMPV